MSERQRRGFSIRMFIPSGNPDGLRIIEKSNWSGCGIVCPRTQLKEFRARDEYRRAGVYVLAGPSEGTDLPRIYIGEADPVGKRLEQHNAGKDFWTTAYVFTSKDGYLNKAHIQYLESRLLDIAQETKRSELENIQRPEIPSLYEADQADAAGFLDEMRLCFPVLGLKVFDRPTVRSKRKTVPLLIRAKGIEAVGYESPEGFIVQKGSQVVSATVPSIHAYLVHLRETLKEKKVIVKGGEALQFTQDYVFNSPSTAAGVVLGRSANGRQEWQDKQGRALKSLQEADAEASAHDQQGE